MKRLMMFAGLMVIVCSLGCTQNIRAKQWGGVSTETLNTGRKVINVTWKDNDLWILTRKMTSNDVAETYEFVEKSSFGLMQGKVIIQERK